MLAGSLPKDRSQKLPFMNEAAAAEHTWRAEEGCGNAGVSAAGEQRPAAADRQPALRTLLQRCRAVL